MDRSEFRHKEFVATGRWSAVWVWATVLAALVFLWWRGPRVIVEETVDPLQLPDDLDGYLRNSESRFPNIRAGTEKKIIWADPGKREKTAVSFIYFHGFTATRQETYPLMECVGQALQANVFYTRLKGHGRPGNALGNVTVKDWLQDAVEALAIGRLIGEKVVVVGTSTGATLVAWLLARQNRDDLLAAVLLSPNFGLQDRRSELFLYPWANIFVPLISGSTRSREPSTEADALYWTNNYPSRALLPMMGLVDVVRMLNYRKLKIPLLMIYAPDDTVIDIGEMKRVFDDWGGRPKQLLPVTNTTHSSHHVIVGDIREPQNNVPLTQAIASFVDFVHKNQGDPVVGPPWQ